ncbi:MAG: UDP-N-acetylglucosamine pyrophosphorylase [Ruthenibacterium sp.]
MLYQTEELFDLQHTMASEFLKQYAAPWEALPHIGAWILEMGSRLPAELYETRGEHIWVAKSARVAASALLTAPCIVDENAEIRHCAFIRGNALIGKGAVVGNSCEVKNAIIFDAAEVPHFNYVGDSILGYKAHLGAGAVTSNVKNDKSLVCVKNDEETVQTGLKKMGAMVGDGAQVGCNSVLCPGAILGKACKIYPLSLIRGTVCAGALIKTNGAVDTFGCHEKG